MSPRAEPPHDAPLDDSAAGSSEEIRTSSQGNGSQGNGRAVGEGLKRAILDEARRVLVDEGYRALSTRKIGRAVGCTATSIYLYFENKDALVHALVAEGFERMNQDIEEAIVRVEEETGSRRLGLRSGARALVDFALQNPAFYEVMFLLPFDQLDRYPAPLYRRARATFERFAVSSELERSEALLRATSLLATLHGLSALLLHKRVDASVDVERLIENTVDTALAAAFPDEAR